MPEGWKAFPYLSALHRPEIPPSFLVFIDPADGLIKAKNGRTGVIDFEGPDASTVIQTALNGLTVGRTRKETVVLKGNFGVLNTVGISSYTVFDLSAASLTVQVGFAGTYVLTGGQRDIEIRGGLIDGDNISKTLPVSAIAFIPATTLLNILIENVEITKIRDGISFSGLGGQNINVVGNNIHDLYNDAPNYGQGITVNAAYGDFYDVKISGNRLRNIGYAPSAAVTLLCPIDGSHKIYRATVTQNMIGELKNGDCIQLYFHVYDSVVANNVLFSWYRSPIKLDGSSRNVVSDNVIIDYNLADYLCAYGIHVFARNDQPADDNLIVNNNLYTYKTYLAIMIEGTAAKSVLRNEVIENKIYRTADTTANHGAILVTYAGLGTKIVGNSIFQARAGGIYVALSDQVLIQGNLIDKPGYSPGVVGHGINVVGNNHIITGNTIRQVELGGTGNTSDGILIAGTNNIIEHNIIVDFNNKAKYLIEVSGGTGGFENIIRFNTVKFGGVSGKISLVGSNIVCKNTGFLTENTVLSPAFAIDGVATVTVTIPHGLDVTPAIEDCSLTVLEVTNVDDWGYNLVKVDNVGAVNVVAKINVTVASATGGATAKLSLRVGKA